MIFAILVMNVSIQNTQPVWYLSFLWYKGTYLLPYTSKSLHTITLWAPWTTWWQYPSMFCVSFTEILDYGKRALYSMGIENWFYVSIRSKGLLLGCSADSCVNSAKWTFTIISSPGCFSIFISLKVSSVNHQSTRRSSIKGN